MDSKKNLIHKMIKEIKVFHITLLLLISTLYFGTSHCQVTNQKQNFSFEIRFFRQTLILPAVKNLKMASEKDPNLILWLDLLELRTPLTSHTGPVAYERRENGMPVVQIDVSFISRCFSICDLASLIIIGPPDNLMFEIGKSYGEEISKSLKSNKPPPHLKVDIDEYNLDEGLIFSSNTIANYAMGTTMQWIILHEIAHHQLKHFDRNPRNLAESREWELAADSWAFKKMKELGFSLHPLESIIMVFFIEEELKKLAGLGISVESSTHPDWNQRYNNLLRFDSDKPPDFGNWISIFEFSSDPITGKWYTNLIAIPRKPMPGIPAQMDQLGKYFWMPVKHSTDGRIHLYGRTGNIVNEIIISNIDTYYPKIKYIFKNLVTGDQSTIMSSGYQIDQGSIMSGNIKGLNASVRDVLHWDPIIMFKEYLLVVETRPEVINKVVNIQKEMLQDVDNIMMSYAKGSFSLQYAIQLYQQKVEKKANEMKIWLGNEKFERMKSNMLSSSTTFFAYDRLLKQLEH